MKNLPEAPVKKERISRKTLPPLLAGSRFCHPSVRALPSTGTGHGSVPVRINRLAEPGPSRGLAAWKSIIFPSAIAVWGASSFCFRLARRPAFEEPTLDGTWVAGGVLKRSALNEARMMAMRCTVNSGHSFLKPPVVVC
jgi:hypothetical protein